GIEPVIDDLYWYAYEVGALHCGSVDPFMQTHGLICGPLTTGPPIAWLVTVMLDDAPLAVVAVSVFAPSFKPVSRPSYNPLGRTANWEVTVCVPRVILTSLGSVPAGRITATSARPPEMRSARLDRTLI